MRYMIAFAALGIGLGSVLRFPAFALLMIISLAMFAIVRMTQSVGVAIVYELLIAAIAMQSGYFLAVLARISVRHIRQRR
jgi:hypothetical protein